MAIFKMLLSNKIERYSEWIFEDFEFEKEILLFKQKVEIDGDKIIRCQKVESLVDLLSDLVIFDDFTHTPEFHFNVLLNQFGIELLRLQFQPEISDLELLLSRVQALADKKYDDQAEERQKDYEEYMESERLSAYENYSNPEIDASIDEIGRWDEETDGSWRIGRDLG